VVLAPASLQSHLCFFEIRAKESHGLPALCALYKRLEDLAE
jgi:hypothetical protein